MEVTRDVILDLMPLYIADEASADTCALVEEYLEIDADLAKIAEQLRGMELSKDIPVPLTKENQMEAYKETKRLISQRIIILAFVIVVVVISFLALAGLVAMFLLSA